MSDQCGYPTGDGDGEPCQNPAGENGRCWIPSHNDADAENPHGRPSELKEYWDDIMAGARQGMTLKGCARLAGVDESTLHRWKKEHDDFSKSLKRARAHGELQHLQSVNDTGSRFILERSFGYVKTENRNVDLDAEVDATHEHEHGLDDDTRDLIDELEEDLKA